MSNFERIHDALSAALLQKQTAHASIHNGPNIRPYLCSVGSCGRRAYARGYCNAHYMRARKGLPLEIPIRARKRADTCSKCGAETGHKGGWGMCQRHYCTEKRTALKAAAVLALGDCCSRCKQQYPLSVYDFHHVGQKDGSPSVMFLNSSLVEIARELNGCVLLCANCHRVIHHEQ